MEYVIYGLKNHENIIKYVGYTKNPERIKQRNVYLEYATKNNYKIVKKYWSEYYRGK